MEKDTQIPRIPTHAQKDLSHRLRRNWKCASGWVYTPKSGSTATHAGSTGSPTVFFAFFVMYFKKKKNSQKKLMIKYKKNFAPSGSPVCGFSISDTPKHTRTYMSVGGCMRERRDEIPEP